MRKRLRKKLNDRVDARVAYWFKRRWIVWVATTAPNGRVCQAMLETSGATWSWQSVPHTNFTGRPARAVYVCDTTAAHVTAGSAVSVHRDAKTLGEAVLRLHRALKRGRAMHRAYVKDAARWR